MSLLGALRTGMSGMNAQSNRISTVAENVQNAGTTGYKRVSTEFSSLLLSSSATGDYNSGSVETVQRRAVSDEGARVSTSSKSDLAIAGNGFFVVKDASGASYLTRAGNFVPDGSTGTFKNAAGFTLMGYSLKNGQASPTLNSLDGMVPVNISALGMKASASTKGALTGNLDSTAAAVTSGAVPAGSNYSKKTSLVTYDNLGKAVTLDIYLTKTGDNAWSASVYDASNSASFPASPLTTIPLGFVNGKVTSGGTGSVTVPNGQPVSLDLTGMTQLASATDIKGSADGSKASAVTGAEFAADGTVYAVYEDNSKVAAFKIPIADVDSPDNLKPRAGNVYETTLESGALQVGFANQGGRGGIVSGALEQSNVDVSTELTSMIASQTVYTANSKVFMTSNEMLDTLMQLKR